MHVFLYEWITGGGLVEQPGPLPPSLLTEGSAMATALASDFKLLDGCRVSALRDMRLDEPALPGCAVVEVHSAAHGEQEAERLVSEADYTLVVAPEFDLILARTLRRFRGHGALLNGGPEFIATASNKHRTAKLLAASGVPTPEAVIVEADQERLPADFTYPAVLKPVDGAGSQHTLLVHGPGDEPAPHPWPRRLERYCPGRAASAAFLCGPTGEVALPPCWQRLSEDGRFTYLGGAVITEPPLAERAVSLGRQTLKALGGAIGFVGVDLVLGNSSDGSEDFVIEVNPRVTTSYVGLRQAITDNVADLMIQLASGATAETHPTGAPIEFSASGSVWRSV